MKNLIKIGTLAGGDSAVSMMPELIRHGFESVAINYFGSSGNADFAEIAKKLKDKIGDSGIIVPCIGVYCNPLRDEAGIKEWEKCIDNAHAFGADIVTGFAGRLDDISVDKNMPRFKEVFTELAKRAQDKGVRLAFENCYMGGDWHRGSWNIANSPLAWDMMFDAVPLDNIGLEWEPSHHMNYLRDPIAALKKYIKRVFHIHGKDANIDWDSIREYGIDGARYYACDRFPGYGDTDWKQVLSILYKNNYAGTIDIEGYHDPYFNKELEFTATVASLKYLKECRGGDFVPNP